MTNCPICDVPVEVPDRPLLSEILQCGDCQSELEIVALDPALLALAPAVEEDWGE